MKINEFMGIYIHIPFCIKKCNYCDFLSFPTDEAAMKLYTDFLIKRMETFSHIYGNFKVSTVFIGGGTPSILPTGLISKIMSALNRYFDLSLCSEITIECNPGTVNESKLTEYFKSGINRISFGLQSANNKELNFIGRIHTYDDFLKSYELAIKCGFTNINIDLMSALPYQTLESYKDTLQKVVSLKPTHISSYSLILEEGTPMYDVDKALLPDEDTEREMYYLTDKILKEHGYNRYEISNYSLSGYECAHNSSYWKRVNYLGIGLGSASLMTLNECYEGTSLQKNIRFSETPDMNIFCNDLLLAPSYDILSFTEVMEEFMFLGLRMTTGISINQFKEIFGYDIDSIYGSVINSLCSKKLIERNSDYIYLTALGFDVSNVVLAEFLEPQLPNK